MKINVNANYFRLACITASKEAARFYLQGVCIQAAPQGGVFLVSTDGHRMTVLFDCRGSIEGAESVIVPAHGEEIGLILKACKPKRDEYRELVLTGSESRPDASVIVGGDAVASKPVRMIEGAFPDWRRVVPRLKANERGIGSYDGRYLADFAEIAGALTEGRSAPMSIAADDDMSPALVRFGVDVGFGVLMPLRSHAQDAADLPAWMHWRPSDAIAA